MARVKRLFLSEMPCHRSQGDLGARLDQAVKPRLLPRVWKQLRREMETSAQERKEQPTA